MHVPAVSFRHSVCIVILFTLDKDTVLVVMEQNQGLQHKQAEHHNTVHQSLYTLLTPEDTIAALPFPFESVTLHTFVACYIYTV